MNYLTDFHPTKTAPFIIKQTAKHLREKFPDVNYLPRHGLQLQRHDSAKQLDNSQADDHFLTTHSLLRSIRYWSYDPLERVGLNFSFLNDLLETVQNNETQEAPILPSGSNPIDAVLNKYRLRQELDTLSQNSNPEDYKVYHRFQIMFDQHHLLILSAQETCPLKLFSTAIFNLNANKALPSNPQCLPNLQYFDATGYELFPQTPASSWGPLIKDVLKHRVAYFTCGFLIFKLNYIKQVIRKTSGLFFLTDTQK